jgi:hypothetical protein
VLPDDGLELDPVFVLDRSDVVVVARPENSAAVNARAVTSGCVTVIVVEPGIAVTLCAARITVRIPSELVTSALAVYVLAARSAALTAPLALSMAKAITTLCPLATPPAGTETTSVAPAVLLDAWPSD